MQNTVYNVIGVMSGTSLDGIDLAKITFTLENEQWFFKIEPCETIPYSKEWVGWLQEAVGYSTLQLQMLNENYTELLAGVIRDFIEKHNIKEIDAVCSHGHTILHQPQNGFTLQIGNLPKIAELVGQKVVCDFRVQDVELGGQGAPLVPIGDRLLFADYDYCLNLGGFSNISFEENGNRIAFDISPVNTVLNFYAGKLGYAYDDRGKLAGKGIVSEDLLNELNALPFYKAKHPKSLGFEFVKETIFPLIEKYKLSEHDVLATFTKHIAFQVAQALPVQKGKLLITGGGAYNDFLLELIKLNLPDVEVAVPDAGAIEFKEALIFGLLGVLKLRNEINVLASVTGAGHNHSSGRIYDIPEKL